jgi:hypothetical protein
VPIASDTVSLLLTGRGLSTLIIQVKANARTQSDILQGHPSSPLDGGPSPNLQVLLGNAEPTAEEANEIARRIGELRSFLESLHPPPILPPIAQGQQLGVEIQAQGNSDENHQMLQLAVDTEDVQDTHILPEESMVAGVLTTIFVRRIGIQPRSTSTRWNFVSAA